MSRVVELFGQSVAKSGVNWQEVVAGQQCVYLNKKCYKIRKSDPDTAIDLLGNNELKLLKQLPRNGFKAFDSESLKPLSRLAFEVF